jgi:hypothetical protein
MEGEQPVPVKGNAEPRPYIVVSGTADASRPFVGALCSASWARRLLYNAAIDPRVGFAEGVSHRIALSAALRDGSPPPVEPVRFDMFLPVPDPYELNQLLTTLRERHAELRKWPATMLRIAIAEACTARSRHVEACALAKSEGRKLPRLHFRSAVDDLDVSTESFRLSRCGDGPALTKPKRCPAAVAKARQSRNESRAVARDHAWAERRRAAGMREYRVLAGLCKRAERRSAQRAANTARDAVPSVPDRNAKLPRRDSPCATIGATRAKLDVQGLGRVRVRLSRPIPDGAEIVRVHFVKAVGECNRVEIRLVMTVPAERSSFDEFTTGAAIHAVVRRLPPTASPLDAVEAVEAAGIKVRGDDWNVSAPSADHTGRKTKRVAIRRSEVVALRDLQQDLSHKDRLLLGARKAKTASVMNPAEEPSADAAPKARRRPPKRSRTALKVKRRIARIGRKLADRAKTRACQDARVLATDVVLVATDPQRMARPLLAKGGPAERRAQASLGIPATIPPEQRPPRGYQLTPAQQRAMRRNMHMARPGYRVRRLALLCATAGVIHATPGHEGSTRTCPKCEAVEAKTLDQRVHDCPRCGLVMPRDRASALVTLGRALLEYREGPDPQGRIAERRAALAESLRKASGLRERRAKGGRRTVEARRQRAQVQVQSAGASPAGDAPASSLQGVVPLRSERSGRNIGASMAASGDRNSN